MMTGRGALFRMPIEKGCASVRLHVRARAPMCTKKVCDREEKGGGKVGEGRGKGRRTGVAAY